MRDRITQLVAQAASEKDADAFRVYLESAADLQQLTQIGGEILTHLPFKPGGCAHLTAFWVTLARDRLKLPVHQVVGHLAINSTVIFGKPGDVLASTLSGSTLEWDGHSWLVLGDQIGEISAFRTAYSSKSPPLLSATIRRHFGDGRGLMLATAEQWLSAELEYRPLRVLTELEVEGLTHGTKDFYSTKFPA